MPKTVTTCESVEENIVHYVVRDPAFSRNFHERERVRDDAWWAEKGPGFLRNFLQRERKKERAGGPGSISAFREISIH
jgi:hypothetical protein